MANLADPRTNIQGFFSELDDAARVVAPVSKTNARLFTTMADTFGAISADKQALKDTIAKAPGTLDTGTRSLRVQRPFLEHTAALSADLDAAAVELRRALPDVNGALARRRRCSAACTSSTSRCSRRSTRSTGSSRRRRRTGRCAACRRPIGTRRAAGPLPRPVHHGLQRLELLLDDGGRAPLGARRHRQLAARAAEHRPRRAGHDAVGDEGANEFAHGQGAPPGTARARTSTAPSTARPSTPEGRADCGAGQTGYTMAGNPYRDKGVQGDPYRRATVDRFPDRRPARPDVQAARSQRQGRRPRPGARAGRRDVHRRPRRPRRRRPEGRHAVSRARRRRAAADGRVRRRRPHAARGRRRDLLRLHEGDPVPPPLHGVGGLPVGEQHPPNAPVRIAGVNVGKVTGSRTPSDGAQAAVVTMRIERKGLPIHRDATVKIRPRIFLEGNFFVDVQPGSPIGADGCDDGDRIPVDQTAAPVQLDQVLAALQAPTRAGPAGRCCEELSTGLDGGGARAASTARSRTGARPTATRAIVADAPLGEHEHDLSRLHPRRGPRSPRRSTATRASSRR